MRIAVAGSTGLIGTALALELRASGHEVVRLIRTKPPVKDSPLAIRWDPAAESLDRGALAGVDAVVNLCGRSIGTSRWSESEKQALVASRVEPTRLLSQTMADSPDPPGVLLNASAIGWYGDRGDEELTESSGPGDGFLGELCRAWEQSTRPAEDRGLRVAHLRTGLVLSHRGGFLDRPRKLFKLGLGGRLGDGRQYWSWISLRDEIAAIVFLLDHGLSGPVNLTAPHPVTNGDFTRAFAAALHRPAVLPLPRPVGRLALGRQLADEVVFGGQRVLPAVLENAGFAFGDRTLETALDQILEG